MTTRPTLEQIDSSTLNWIVPIIVFSAFMLFCVLTSDFSSVSPPIAKKVIAKISRQEGVYGEHYYLISNDSTVCEVGKVEYATTKIGMINDCEDWSYSK